MYSTCYYFIWLCHIGHGTGQCLLAECPYRKFHIQVQAFIYDRDTPRFTRCAHTRRRALREFVRAGRRLWFFRISWHCLLWCEACQSDRRLRCRPWKDYVALLAFIGAALKHTTRDFAHAFAARAGSFICIFDGGPLMLMMQAINHYRQVRRPISPLTSRSRNYLLLTSLLSATRRTIRQCFCQSLVSVLLDLPYWYRWSYHFAYSSFQNTSTENIYHTAEYKSIFYIELTQPDSACSSIIIKNDLFIDEIISRELPSFFISRRPLCLWSKFRWRRFLIFCSIRLLPLPLITQASRDFARAHRFDDTQRYEKCAKISIAAAPILIGE